jgi:hypothetical protein
MRRRVAEPAARKEADRAWARLVNRNLRQAQQMARAAECSLRQSHMQDRWTTNGATGPWSRAAWSNLDARWRARKSLRCPWSSQSCQCCG